MRCQGLLRLSLLAAVLALAASLKHLQIAKMKEVKEEDCPRKTKVGDKLTVDYTGTLKDGTIFESSAHEDHRDPAIFMLGRGEVIQGWEEGLLDMCVGERRKLSVPPSMAYGETGQKHHPEHGKGSIPRGATVYFEMELLKIEDGTEEIDVFKNIDLNGDEQLSQEEVSAFLRVQEKAMEMDPSDEIDHNEMVADVFHTEDENRDGHISRDEFSGPKTALRHDGHDEL